MIVFSYGLRQVPAPAAETNSIASWRQIQRPISRAIACHPLRHRGVADVGTDLNDIFPRGRKVRLAIKQFYVNLRRAGSESKHEDKPTRLASTQYAVRLTSEPALKIPIK